MRPISGQIILREGGRHPSGKRLMMIVGIIAVPEVPDIVGEHQYTVSGMDLGGLLQLNINTTTRQDVSEQTRGSGLGHLITQPMWRIG